MSDIDDLKDRIDKLEEERKTQVTQLQLAIKELREFGGLKDQAIQALDQLNSDQSKRLEKLREVSRAAVNQYFAMRDDALEDEMTRDQGVPMWLSVLLSAGITLIPISALTAAFIGELASGTRRMLTSSTRSRLNEKVRLPRYREQRAQRRQDMQALSAEINDVDELITKLAKNWEPELSNFLQNMAEQLKDADGKQFFEVKRGQSPPPPPAGKPSKDGKASKDENSEENAGRPFERTDAPPVVVQQSLNRWIESVEKAVETEYNQLHSEILALHGTATAQLNPPPKDAAPAEKSRAKEEADNKAKAQEQLEARAEDIATDLPEADKEIMRKDLRDLQLIVEMAIWCTTYNFTPRVNRGERGRLRGGERISYEEVVPIPLPGGLWKRLTERYARLLPPMYVMVERAYTSQLALSMFFSEALYPELNRQNSETVRKWGALKLKQNPDTPRLGK